MGYLGALAPAKPSGVWVVGVAFVSFLLFPPCPPLTHCEGIFKKETKDMSLSLADLLEKQQKNGRLIHRFSNKGLSLKKTFN